MGKFKGENEILLKSGDLPGWAECLIRTIKESFLSQLKGFHFPPIPAFGCCYIAPPPLHHFMGASLFKAAAKKLSEPVVVVAKPPPSFSPNNEGEQFCLKGCVL